MLTGYSKNRVGYDLYSTVLKITQNINGLKFRVRILVVCFKINNNNEKNPMYFL